MTKYEEMKNRVLLLDGAMGTMLQREDIEIPEASSILSVTDPYLISSIHRKYVEAGADIIYANTFDANRYKLEGTGYEVGQVIHEAVQAARMACNEDTLVAVSTGTLGQLMEPLGNMGFEEAYEGFRQIVTQAEQSGADLVVVETMTDIYEVKAAVLAVKENTDLPVFVSMSFEENGRTFTGCSIENMVLVLEALDVDAIGINCSLGPIEIFPLANEMCKLTDLPVFIKPNAGLPDPHTGAYDISSQQFISTMEGYVELGVNMMGGCCGTDPDYIAGLFDMLQGRQPMKKLTKEKTSRVCSATKVVDISGVTVIGERLNPTGKKALKEALINEDFDYILKQAIFQIDDGAQILDVNVGIPDVNEEILLPKIVRKIQSVTDVPLQIDSSDPRAIEAALRVYNGKPIVNSVNGETEVLRELLPVIKHYGAAVVGLTLDEEGIPKRAEGRFDIAQRILTWATETGISPEDVYIDCLTLTASAEQEIVTETLDAIRMVKNELGLKTVLGVSNISFGLPNRPLINRVFLTMAMEEGLDLPIINPGDAEMMGAVYAFEMLQNRDENAEKYIEKYKNWTAPEQTKVLGQSGNAQSEGVGVSSTSAMNACVGSNTDPGTGGAIAGAGTTGTYSDCGMFDALLKGLQSETESIVKSLLVKTDELTIINEYLVPALDRVGKGFESGEIFLPQMMQAATAAQAGFSVIKAFLAQSGRETVPKGTVVIATVKGDIHDIGKNIVKTIMENYGYEIIDLGKDVPAERIVEAVIKCDAKLVGLSALMTTTLASMAATIKAVKAARPECSIMVGGAVLTEEYAAKIGADYYCSDAMKSVEAAKTVFGA